MEEVYKKQVSLLLDVLPEVAKEDCFALHGGTALNLFVRDMPRLSVDIDLTYVPIEDRETSLENINQALLRIKDQIHAVNPNSRIKHQSHDCKLQVSVNGVQIKIEVNMVVRGTLHSPKKTSLCLKAQNQFDAFCSVRLVPFGQLYGSKICAALDRQHPRDLFDIKLLFENEGVTEEIKHGFLLGAISSARPVHELLNPILQDQQQAFENQFQGMTDVPFSYTEYRQTRVDLIRRIKKSLTEQDKNFLVSVNKTEPDWGIYDFERFPSVQWKLQNLRKLQETNPQKYIKQCEMLKTFLQTESSL